MAIPQTTKNRINKELSKLGNYHNEIPLDKIFEILISHNVFPVDCDGSPWSGILCGDNSYCTFQLEGQRKSSLYLSWYKMQSGRIEITVYLS